MKFVGRHYLRGFSKDRIHLLLITLHTTWYSYSNALINTCTRVRPLGVFLTLYEYSYLYSIQVFEYMVSVSSEVGTAPKVGTARLKHAAVGCLVQPRRAARRFLPPRVLPSPLKGNDCVLLAPFHALRGVLLTEKNVL